MFNRYYKYLNDIFFPEGEPELQKLLMGIIAAPFYALPWITMIFLLSMLPKATLDDAFARKYHTLVTLQAIEKFDFVMSNYQLATKKPQQDAMNIQAYLGLIDTALFLAQQGNDQFSEYIDKANRLVAERDMAGLIDANLHQKLNQPEEEISTLTQTLVEISAKLDNQSTTI